tara:strand:- start:197 stop:703 length:507 start_codon:yes stop_codon:yes gene_type:complete
MILWFTGISGVGKSLIANNLYKILHKTKKNLVHVDGDIFRKMLGNDLGYTLKDRDKNAVRIINFVTFLNKQGINVIVSANLTSKKYRLYCKKKFKKFLEVSIYTDYKTLKKRDKKNIYKSKNLSNVVGYGIKNTINNTASLKITNNGSKKDFIKNIFRINKIIKKKLI